VDEDVSKEHEYETKVDLSVGQVVSVRWRRLPPIRANDLFSRRYKSANHSETVRALSLTFSQKQQKSL
jgi:hypothetical protein